jgi:hypothetical protein
MDKQIILRKIASLKRCIDRIENKIPETSEKLQTDYDSQDIVSLNLQRAVQVCVNWDIVFSISTTDLNGFRLFSKEILIWMNGEVQTEK